MMPKRKKKTAPLKSSEKQSIVIVYGVIREVVIALIATGLIELINVN